MKYPRLITAFLLTLTALLCAHAGTLAQFRTIFGDVDVELYDHEKPVTTANFKRLVNSGAYQNTFFHRVVPSFVAQGGGYLSVNPFSTNLFGPPWSNLGAVPNFGTITNEYSVGPFFSNTNRTIAMAKQGGNPNSATSEWFFNLGNNSTNLDNQNGGFTVFGRVIRDTGPPSTGGLLGLFNLFSYGDGLVNMGWWYPTNSLATNLFAALPVTYSGPVQPRYTGLFYVDISLLSVRLTTKTNGAREISWNSVSNKVNYVEYTTNFPPVWQQLTATNGNGSRFAVLDNTTTDKSRFYRVRVLY